MSMNITILTGNLARDPELTYTPTGVAKVTATLAVNRGFKTEQGEREADFIPLIMWRKTAETAANYLKKGSKIGVRGRWQTRNYEKDGKRVYVHECVVDELEFLTPLDRNGGGQQQQQPPQQYGEQPNQQYSGQQQPAQQYGDYNAPPPNNSKYDPYQKDPFGPGGKPTEVHEDDLPF